MSDNGWKEVETQYPKTIKFADLAPDTVLEGTYVEMKPVKTKLGREAKVYSFRGTDGETFEVFGVAALDGKMSQVPAGNYVRILYKGKGRNGRGVEFHDVRLQYREEIPT